LLGLPGKPCLPAFRGLLLPGNRLRHHPWPAARRSRRAGRSQDSARLPAGADVFGALDRRRQFPPRHRRLFEARTARGRARDRRADGVLAVQERKRVTERQPLVLTISTPRKNTAKKIRGSVAPSGACQPTLSTMNRATQKTAVASTAARKAIQSGRKAFTQPAQALGWLVAARRARAAGR